LALAIAVGVFARLKGLGKWPFSGDEFHTVQAVRYILEKGVPEFPSGGYYMRGILLQYLMAFSSILGLKEEFGYRLVTAVFNLSAFPAIYLLGKKISGTMVACAATAIFSLSLWEIEFARFARMYAPFQAVFIWYIYFLYMAVVEGKKTARRWMLGLSLFSLFLYEGGIFLLVLNFFPLLFEKVEGRLNYAFLSVGLLLGGYWFLTTKFGTIGAIPPLPAGYHTAGSREGSVLLPSILGFAAVKKGGISGAMFSLFYLFNFLFVFLVFKGNPAGWRDWRRRLCLVVIVIACAMNLFFLAFSIGLAFLLLEWISFEDKRVSYARIAVWASLFNLAFVSTTFFVANFPGLQSFEKWPGLIMDFLLISFKYPNLLNKVIYQWISAFPVHCVLLTVVAATWIFVLAVRNIKGHLGFKFLSAVTIVVLLGVSMLKTPYDAPRYSFFAYPMIVIIFCISLFNLVSFFAKRQPLNIAVCITSILGFLVLSEDFSVKHAFAVDSEKIFFRIGMNKWQRVHYYPNMDTRGVAKVVNANLKNGDIVISRMRPVCYYLTQVDYVFYANTGPEFANYSSSQGTREKWTGAKLIYHEDALWQLLEKSEKRIWLITQSEKADWVGSLDAKLHEKFKNSLVFTSLDGKANVYLILPSGAGT
jgi:hypothetical protein